MLITTLLLAALLPAGATGPTLSAPATGERMVAGAGIERDRPCGKKRNRGSRLPRNRNGLPCEEDESRTDPPKVSPAGLVVGHPVPTTHFLLHAHPAAVSPVAVKRYLVLHILLI